MSRDITVFVTVGTDHHYFDRLLEWVDNWRNATQFGGRLVIQNGATAPLVDAEQLGIVSQQELRDLMRSATVVVSQASPGLLADARETDVKPIMVPRLSALNEVVDDHQIAFGEYMGAEGEAFFVRSEEELVQTLNSVIANPDLARLTRAPRDISDVIDTFSRAVDETMARRPGFISLRRLRRKVSAKGRSVDHV